MGRFVYVCVLAAKKISLQKFPNLKQVLLAIFLSFLRLLDLSGQTGFLGKSAKVLYRRLFRNTVRLGFFF